MTSNLRLQWYLVIALLVSTRSVRGGDKDITDHQSERLKRNTLPIIRNDLAGESQDGPGYLQTEQYPYADFSDSEAPESLQNSEFVSKQFGDSYSPSSPAIADVESPNLQIDPLETRSSNRYIHSFVGKREPEIDSNERLEFDELNDFDDDIEVTRRRAPQFNHNFVGKRQYRDSYNGNPLKRIPVQLFARRAPHYSHSFVGKRSADGANYNDIPHRNSFADSDSFLEKNSAYQHPSYKQIIPDNSNVINFKSAPSLHNIVKRAASIEKRAPGFGHSFVGKRGPRFGHSFVGKREDDPAESIEAALIKYETGADPSISITPVGFPEQTDFDISQDSFLDDPEMPDKRQHRTNQNPSSYLGKRPSFSHSFVGKRGPSFGHSFVGKRGPNFGHSFVGKRGPNFGHSFVGKRGPNFGHSFVGKRGPNFGHSFVGKRGPNFGHSFVGKRPGFSHSFVGKRSADLEYNLHEKQDSSNSIESGSEEDNRGDFVSREMFAEKIDNFSSSAKDVLNRNNSELYDDEILQMFANNDKRQPSFSHGFVGKRAPGFGLSFEEKRGPGFGHSFVGKRAPNFGHSFVGKRAPSFGHSFVGKRAPSFGHSFVGKRAPSFGHSFVGKRAPGFGHSFVGKRAPSFGHSFVGKRAPSFGHSFVGKRAPSFGHSFVGKRAPSFGHSFVGKRAPSFGHSFVGKRAPSFGHSFVGKRAPRFGHSFVGKRSDNEIVIDDDLLENNLGSQDVADLVELIQTEGSGNSQEIENVEGATSKETASF